MPRTRRATIGGYCYHILNRRNPRAQVFHKSDDDTAFLAMMTPVPRDTQWVAAANRAMFGPRCRRNRAAFRRPMHRLSSRTISRDTWSAPPMRHEKRFTAVASVLNKETDS